MIKYDYSQISRLIYTYALNKQGGVAADFTVVPITSANGEATNPMFNVRHCSYC